MRAVAFVSCTELGEVDLVSNNPFLSTLTSEFLCLKVSYLAMNFRIEFASDMSAKLGTSTDDETVLLVDALGTVGFPFDGKSATACTGRDASVCEAHVGGRGLWGFAN